MPVIHGAGPDRGFWKAQVQGKDRGDVAGRIGVDEMSIHFFLLRAAAGRERPFANIRAQIDPAVADRTLRDDLLHLKRLGLINSRGHGREAVWFLAEEPRLGQKPNKAE